MGKVNNYLKHFFMFDEAATYEMRDYQDYTGIGFKSYKISPYFKRPGIHANSGYFKSEVAAFSEMTKIALLIGMALIALIAIWWDIKALQFLIQGFFAPGLLFGSTLLTIVLNAVGICMIPRSVFLIKNFRIIKK